MELKPQKLTLSRKDAKSERIKFETGLASLGHLLRFVLTGNLRLP